MTICDLYIHATNIDDDTIVQLYKRSESAKYYTDSRENLSFLPMPIADIRISDAIIRNFWYETLDEIKYVTRLLVLLEGEEL